MAVRNFLLQTFFTLLISISSSHALPGGPPGCHFLRWCPKAEVDYLGGILIAYCSEHHPGPPGNVGGYKVEMDLNYHFQNVDGYLQPAKAFPGDCMKSCAIVRPLEEPGARLTTVCLKLDGTSVENTMEMDRFLGYDHKKRELFVCNEEAPHLP